MVTPTIDLMHRHASVRRFKADPVPAELIETIVAAAQRASTSSNLQLVSVVAVTEAAKRARLAEICGQEHVAQAPAVLVWCADLSRLDRACELRGYRQVTEYVENFLVCTLDIGIAAQNGALAAESLGLGMCYLGSIRNHVPGVIDLLMLPRLVFPVVGMVLGWPAVPGTVRPRLPIAAVLHRETYDPAPKDAALHEYDRTMIATGIYEGRQVGVPGKSGEVEEYGWLEHSARRVSQAARTDLRLALKRQGFPLE
ncbi:MAG TPA: NADPH-dependent oxidoreductase [Candidatus Methylomirabilis sp.]|nr:NADPH-dependent oxidoreductase [Candidatus Methylomirabilis sp.]